MITLRTYFLCFSILFISMVLLISSCQAVSTNPTTMRDVLSDSNRQINIKAVMSKSLRKSNRIHADSDDSEDNKVDEEDNEENDVATTNDEISKTDTTELILENELQWAEDSLEHYHRKNGRIPLRVNLQDDTKHVYSKKWIDESTKHLRKNHQEQERPQESQQQQGRRRRQESQQQHLRR